MIAGTLKASGLRTGLYTSPHLYEWQERISLDGRPISKTDFARLASLIQPEVNVINHKAQFGKITTFEALTAMAFLHFRDKKAGAQVLETGMGGRLDATNVCVPDVCVITSLSLDHTQILGNTIEEIAAEKAGIIKRGAVVVSAPQSIKAAAVIAARCRSLDARLIQVGRDITWQRLSTDFSGQSLAVKGRLADYRLRIPLLGDFQLENAAVAIGALEALIERGVKIRPGDVATGLRHVRWPARLQVLQRSPLLIADGAHNMYSIEALINTLRSNFNFKRAFVIFGASADKDITGMARTLSLFADKIVLTRSNHSRAASIDQMLRGFNGTNAEIAVGNGIEDCLRDMLAIACKDDLILVTGSLFLAAEAATAYKRLYMRKTLPPVTDAGCSKVLR
jgi:dihydrofolate synthase/folylpolyglutamate synthase